jgi:flagellar basal body-associated protein FliL
MSRTKYTRKGQIVNLLILFLCFLVLPSMAAETVSAQSDQTAAVAAAPASKPLIVYFSLTGKNKIISAELQKQLNAPAAELKLVSERTGIWGFIVSGYENFFDKDAELQPFTTDLAPHNPIIICSPVWMGKLSSPARTFLKNPALKGKDIYIFASFNGHWAEEKEAEQVKNLTGTGIVLKNIYRMVLGKKTEEEIKKEVITQLEKKPIPVQAAAAH